MTKSKALVSLPGGWPEDFPPRSAFFGLTPLGHNGESFEGLSSYFRRLSAYHGILPRTLAQRAVVPLLEPADDLVGQRALGAACYHLYIDGLSKVTADWVEALEKLTLRRDLSLRTLLPLKSLVSPFLLISKSERFCPKCFEEDVNAKRPMYNRLLWSIACVEACPLHQTILLEIPTVPSVEKRAFWVPGMSRVDGSSLATIRPQFACYEQVVCARLVAELLDDIHHHSRIFVEKNSASSFFRYAVKKLFRGQAAHLAEHIGISKSELHGWMTEKCRPSLPRLVLVAHCCGCCVSDILLGNKVELRRVRRRLPVKCLSTRTRKGSAKNRDELLKDLDEIVGELGPAPTLTAAARLLDVSEKYLRRLAPGIAASIVAKGKAARHERRLQREEQRFQSFRQAVQELTVDGVLPPLYRLRKHLDLKNQIKLGFHEAARFMLRVRKPD